MISVSHLYVNDEPLEELVGSTLVLGGSIAFFGLIIALDKGEKVRELEDSLINVYSDDYLTMELDIDKNKIDNSVFDKLRMSGRFKQKILSENGISLIVNKKAATYMKQKFGKYPMFQIIGTNKTYEAEYNKFMKDHKKLFDNVFSNKLQKAANSESLPKSVRVNAAWLYQILRPFLYTNDLTENVINKVKIQSKKFQTVSFEPE